MGCGAWRSCLHCCTCESARWKNASACVCVYALCGRLSDFLCVYSKVTCIEPHKSVFDQTVDHQLSEEELEFKNILERSGPVEIDALDIDDHDIEFASRFGIHEDDLKV